MHTPHGNLLQQPADTGIEVTIAILALVAGSTLVAMDCFLKVMFGLVNLTHLLPELRLLLVPQQSLHTGVDGVELSMQRPGIGIPRRKKGLVGVSEISPMTRGQVGWKLRLSDTG